MTNYWKFVIDTDSYSGNFERELTAYCTGIVDEYSVGMKETKLYKAEETYNFAELLYKKPDDYGCERPYVIYPTKGRFNDGMGTHWNDDADPKEVQAVYQQSNYDYFGKHGSKPPEDKFGRWPAYESVAILFYKKPTDEQIEIIKRRAEAYTKLEHRWSCQKFKVLGFRLISTDDTEHNI